MPLSHPSRRRLLAGAVLLATVGRVSAGQSPQPAPGPDDLWLGHDAARIDLVEYASLSCPYCAEFALDAWPALRQAYVDTGNVRFTMRDLPDTPQAGIAALALRLASTAESRVETATLLFRRREDWVTAPDTRAALADILSTVGLNRPTLDRVWSDAALHRSVLDSRQRGVELGVARLPGLISNGRLSLGALSAYDAGSFIVSSLSP